MVRQDDECSKRQDAKLGTADRHVPGMQQPANSKLAVASMILGIGCIFLGPLSAIPGLILGIVAAKRIKESGGLLKGRGYAITGIITSVVFPIVLVGIFLLAVVFHLPGGVKLRGRRPESILRAARLADLPNSATNVRAEGWSALFTGEDYLMFQATPQDINNWVAQLSSIRNSIPETFNSDHMHLPYKADRKYYTRHEYYFPMSSNPQWYDLTIRVNGRKYEIPGDPNKGGHNWGTVIINDQTNTVYINVIWS
ncbi:MAG: DUF4190 domain-containing protein [Planctomycetota bacterium]